MQSGFHRGSHYRKSSVHWNPLFPRESFNLLKEFFKRLRIQFADSKIYSVRRAKPEVGADDGSFISLLRYSSVFGSDYRISQVLYFSFYYCL